jgi:hypothetical protein
MKRRRRYGSLGILGGIVLLMIGMASPAYAEVLAGPCVGFAEFSNGVRVTEATPVSVVNEVPEQDTVIYGGDTKLSPPDEEEAFEGNVTIKLPLGQQWTVVNWPVPPGETKEIADAGTYTYEVPSWVPRGAGALEMTAYHMQRGQICRVAVTMKLSGSPGAAAILGTAGTAVFGAGVIGSGFKKRFS